MDINTLKNILQENGIVGAGGAGFPTYAKLDERANTILLNCAECEPLLKLHRQLLEKHAYEIMKTFSMVADVVGADEAIIGVKESYKDTVKALETYIDEFPKVKIHQLPEVYPMGDEVVLIYEATGRVVRPGGLPIEQGVAVFNVETIYNVYRAVEKNHPVTDKLVSVVAEVEHPVTVRVPLGTTIGEVVALAGVTTVKDPVYFVGGPMMGFALYDLHVPCTKTSSAFLFMEHDAVSESQAIQTACINCGRCVGVCPGHVLPARLATLAERGDMAGFEALDGMECCECGCCSYICPAKRPLTQSIKSMRKMVLAERKKKK